jgi:hypothetical protein
MGLTWNGLAISRSTIPPTVKRTNDLIGYHDACGQVRSHVPASGFQDYGFPGGQPETDEAIPEQLNADGLTG